MTTVSATYARAHFYDLVDQVSKTGKRIGITKKGETRVVLVSLKEYEAWHTMAVKFLAQD